MGICVKYYSSLFSDVQDILTAKSLARNLVTFMLLKKNTESHILMSGSDNPREILFCWSGSIHSLITYQKNY